MKSKSIEPISKLSIREKEVAFCILDGIATCAIAEKLGIKSNTVSTIKKNIFQKLSVDSEIALYKMLKH